MAGATVAPIPIRRPWWHAPWEFAVHAVVGILIFLVIALAAIVIELVVRAADAAGANLVISYGLRIAEYAVFAADLLVFLVFIWRTTVKFLKGLE